MTEQDPGPLTDPTQAKTPQGLAVRRSVRRWLFAAAALLIGSAALAAVSWYAVARLRVSGIRERLPPLPDLAGYGAPMQDQIREADRAVREEDPSGANLGGLGQVYQANLFHTEAAACYALAEEVAPADDRWPYYQGILAYDAGLHDRSLGHFERALALSLQNPAPQNPASQNTCLWLRLGDVHLKLQQFAEAADAYRKAGAGPSHRRQALLGLARVAERQGDWAQVVQLLKQPVLKGQALGPAYRLLMSAYQELGQSEEADRLTVLGDYLGVGNAMSLDDPAIRGLEELSCSSTFLLKQASLANASGDQERRRAILLRAVEVAPEDVHCHLALCECCQDAAEKALNLGRRQEGRDLFAQCLEHARAAIRLEPQRGRAHTLCGVALDRMGNIDEAIGSYREAARLAPLQEEPHYLLGRALAKAEKFEEAERACRRAVELNPASAPACYMLGTVLARSRRPKEALEWFERAKQLMPLSPEPDCEIARTLAMQGKRQEAVSLLRSVLARWPDCGSAHQVLREIERSAPVPAQPALQSAPSQAR